MTTAEVLDHLRNRGRVVIERRGRALVRCPAHDDHHPSLAVTTGRDGRTLMHCRAGCRTSDVLAAAGLRASDLFPTTAPARPPKPGTALDTMRDAALELARSQPWYRPEIRARYVAADALKWCDRWGPTARAAEEWALVVLIDSLAIRASLLWAQTEARR